VADARALRRSGRVPDPARSPGPRPGAAQPPDEPR
jgi:hypothetical protein